MPSLTWKQATAWHVRRQHLDKRVPRARLLALTSQLCGLHAQVMSSAELTALCRIEGLRPDDIPRALWKDGTLVKTWAMRSTLHLLPAEELGKWLHAFSHYLGNRTAAWLKYFGVTAGQLASITEAVGEATRGRILTREQLAEEVMRLTGISGIGDKLRMSWGSMLKPACYRGYLCFGPAKGQHAQFTNPGVTVERDQCFAARKYFAAYGPATLRDFARWLQVGIRNARNMMACLGDELAEIDIEGEPAWMLRRDLRAALRTEAVKAVRLLPAFDQYVFAAGIRSHKVLPAVGFHARIYRSQGWFSPVLLVDGRMEGVWKFTRNANRVEVAIEPFVKASATVRRAAEHEAERIAHYMGKPLELRWVQ